MARVLVVDDDDSIRDLIARMVKLDGHEVLTARNGLEAVAVFRSYPDLIDLVITDLRMPVMDGYTEIERIRETRPSAKIICVSAESAERIPAGTVFLPKPFHLKELQRSIHEALGVPVS